MLPDLPTIIECPYCQQQALKESLISGNTFGAVYWTDGKCEAPMLPVFPRLTICDKCQQPYWVEDAKEIEEATGETPLENDPHRIERIEFPSFLEYSSCLGTDIIRNLEDEIYIRTKMWWCYNDYYRNTYDDNQEIDTGSSRFDRSNAVTELTEELAEIYTDNCKFLLKLLNGQKEEDYLTSAELHRNLGEWADSLILLELVVSKELEVYVKKIRKGVELGNKKVQPVS